MPDPASSRCELTVGLGERAYPIVIGGDLSEHTADWIQKNIPTKKVLIVTDSNVAPLYEPKLKAALEQLGFEVHSVIIPFGEASKSYAQLQELLEWALSLGINRNTLMIALGGGVVGDLTGVAASLLLRGIPFVQYPTTLLSQVDSSVGGKTGINSAHGKNLIGSFYQPRAVFIDCDSLKTLPKRELLAGYAEVVKYALLGDAEFFDWLDEHVEDVLNLDRAALNHVIATCCRHKADIVTADEKEKGQRALLNLGHTFGHALELEAGYGGNVLHGEAVAVGMMQAAMLSVRMGLMESHVLEKIEKHWKKSGLPGRVGDLKLSSTAQSLMFHMKKDKKATDKSIVFVLMSGLGEAVLHDAVNDDDLKAVLQQTGAA